jgi:hypothetical protein
LIGDLDEALFAVHNVLNYRAALHTRDIDHLMLYIDVRERGARPWRSPFDERYPP